MASIRDVAKRAGVSPTTVSRTFRTPDLLAEQTQRRVLDAAKQLGYRPPSVDVPALTKAARRRQTPPPTADAIGFLFFANGPQEFVTSHTFYAPVLAGAQMEASALGMHLLVHTTDLTEADAPLPRMALEQAVGGMLLVGAVERSIVDKFAARVPQVVLVDNRDDMGAYESVVSDGFGGGLAAVRYLIGLGHRRICFITTRQGVPTFQDRLRGYWCGLLEAGITPDPSLLITPDENRSPEEDTRYSAARRLSERMKALDPPTAIVAANDSCATFIQWRLQKEGWRVPEDLSLIGFDDMPFAADADPPLTTVRVDREAMGRLAVRRLAALLRPGDIERQAALPLVQYKLPVALIPRGTCLPVKHA